MESDSHPSLRKDLWKEVAITYGCVVLWLFVSAVVIMVNKYVLSFAGFPYPIALTMVQMAFCATLALLIVQGSFVDSVQMNSQTYLRKIVPIAALFSAVLWLGNASYLYLPVAFLQMFKAVTPVTVFLTGVLLGTETYSHSYALNMAVVAVGITTASYGELNFHLLGFLLQAASILCESFRLGLIQVLLQGTDIKLNPVTTIYYIAPACFVLLSLPFSVLELPRLMSRAARVAIPWNWLMLSATSAFALNMAVFLSIGRSSALTMSVAGPVKDWLLICLSAVLYSSPLTWLQILGYCIALSGVCRYNYQKLQSAAASAAASAECTGSCETKGDLESEPLLPQQEEQEKSPARSTVHGAVESAKGRVAAGND